MTCELCQKDSPLYDFTRPCCLIRLAAQAPDPHKRAEFKRIREIEGKEAADAWAVKVKAEIERLKGLK